MAHSQISLLLPSVPHAVLGQNLAVCRTDRIIVQQCQLSQNNLPVDWNYPGRLCAAHVEAEKGNSAFYHMRQAWVGLPILQKKRKHLISQTSKVFLVSASQVLTVILLPTSPEPAGAESVCLCVASSPAASRVALGMRDLFIREPTMKRTTVRALTQWKLSSWYFCIGIWRVARCFLCHIRGKLSKFLS